MKYKNIIFDFGNVIAGFYEEELLRLFCECEKDLPVLYDAIYKNWAAVDAGKIDYYENAKNVEMSVPENLRPTVRKFYREWVALMPPVWQTWQFIRELKKTGAGIYLLSNASVILAENTQYYKILELFDGIVFSAPIKMEKPEPEIYQYLFDTFRLVPEECFFIDDRKDNIQAGRALGMDGIVFTGDVEAVKKAIGF